MKRISLFLLALLLLAPVVRAQDAAVEERLNKLSGQIQDLIEARDEQNKLIQKLSKEVSSLEQQLNKPNTSYASQEDVKQLTAKLKEVDEKRQQDNDRILKEIEKLGKTLTVSPGKKPGTTTPVTPANPANSDKVFKYTIQSGDTLSAIVQAYREKNIKVSVTDILKANQGLKAESLPVGQEINIPAPQ